jgi:DNA replication ATP-dependent helicase Dna2
MTLTPSGFVPYSQSQKTAPASSQAVPPSSPTVKQDEDEDEAMWAELDAPAATSANRVGEEEEVALLPPPIDDEWGCKKCYVRDSCMLFRRVRPLASLFLRPFRYSLLTSFSPQTVEGDLEISADESDPLQILYEEKTGHLTDAHAEFFKHWEKLISYEEQEMVRFKREIWTMEAEEREKVGRCVFFSPASPIQADHISSPQLSRQHGYQRRTNP